MPSTKEKYEFVTANKKTPLIELTWHCRYELEEMLTSESMSERLIKTF